MSKAEGPLFDTTKVRQELEIMQGILNSTMRIAFREAAAGTVKTETARVWASHEANLSGFYLYGQGAVFRVSMPGHHWMVAPAVLGKTFAVPLPPKPPKPPKAPLAPPPPPSNPNAKQSGSAPPAPEIDAVKISREAEKEAQMQLEEARKQLEMTKKDMELAKLLSQEEQLKLQETITASLAGARDSLKEWQLQGEQSREELAKKIALVKPYLIEALAKHGDSITVVKPQEYITLMISRGGRGWVLVGGEEEEGADMEILSVQKSTILDYKAGRISLEEFKKKVFSYLQ
jgi:hypothetical protein